MKEYEDLNEHGNHQGEFHQSVGGWAEYSVRLTEVEDTVRHDVTVPPGKIIPIIFLPGVMGSNLRMSKKRQEELKKSDSRAWLPDDMVDTSGNFAVAGGVGLGGWFKNASPKDRQLAFDQNETEVEYYQYSSDKERFDPDGTLTKASNVRNKNIPDRFPEVPPLITVSEKKLTRIVSGNPVPVDIIETAANIARWRGWSEVFFAGAYGEMLRTTEYFMNNIIKKGLVRPHWKFKPRIPETGQRILMYEYRKLSELLVQNPKSFGASSGEAINDDDMKKISPCWYPVHAMGYNFVQSNGVTAKVIADRIKGLVKGYQKCGFKCDEVIIITHSMGGLLARALIHPSYGNMLNDKDVKILGIYHNVMPTIGAASAYKRMRFGFQEKSGPLNKMAAKIMGVDGQHATAILANAPAPLEMMPGEAYGKDWLKIVNGIDQVLWSWPRGKDTALQSIYLQPNKAWWRLINPGWINPGNVPNSKGGGVENVQKRLKDATIFLKSIEKTFHSNTYASYCASKEFLSYGEIVFKVVDGLGGGFFDSFSKFVPPPPENWTLLTDDAKGTLTVQAGARVLKIELQPASAAGDQTVPSDRSARHINGVTFIHGEKEDMGYEHQKSYADHQVLASMLYSIVQIAKTAKWS